MVSIIEMVIVLVAAAAMTVIGIQKDFANRRAQLFAAEGQNELTLVDAIGDWANTNYATLLAQYTASGSATITPPTVAQLYAAGDLKQAHSAGPFWGGTYVIQMSMVPAGCTEAAGNCAISYAVYPSQPLIKGGTYDVDGASQIAQAGGAQFGYSRNQNASTITGLNGQWTAANPLGSVPGVILSTNGPGTDGNSLYIRRDGGLTWTGSQNVNGVDLHNVGSIDAQGTIAAPTLAASNVAVSNAVQTPGTLQVENAAGTAPAPIDTGSATVNGNETVTGTMTAGTVNFNTTAGSCTWNTVTMRGANQFWVCNQSGQWIPLSQLLSNFQTLTKNVGWQNGWGTNIPTCPNGNPWVTIIPNSAGANVASNPPLETVRFSYYVSGGQYMLHIQEFDASQNAYEDQLGLTAEVDAGCYYANE
ncbi:MAG: hypothetical protein RXR20_00995 [Paraburkholderia sp.]|jgi:hypothetical protein|uniref:hypothetical protein n=1 Tax=Burkholderiaceae TaxID=119060 RepID=UPI0010F8597A|nr:hypothetical protein [Burkholderia sp. 4M9327F10]